MFHKEAKDGTAARARQAQRGPAVRAIAANVRAGVRAYDRARDLPALIRTEPAAADGPEATEAILARLERALRAERSRARAGHWTYDLNRHIALRQAWLAERARLATMRRRGRP
jgi:hypothetical protein